MFATALTCIDGRFVGPLTDWIRSTYGVTYVDVVTHPGLDGAVAERTVLSVRDSLDVSMQAHDSRLVIVAGHHDCAGNPVSDADHRAHVAQASKRVSGWAQGADVVGVFVSADGSVAPI